VGERASDGEGSVRGSMPKKRGPPKPCPSPFGTRFWGHVLVLPHGASLFSKVQGGAKCSPTPFTLWGPSGVEVAKGRRGACTRAQNENVILYVLGTSRGLHFQGEALNAGPSHGYLST
jgi:hypothetical protein